MIEVIKLPRKLWQWVKKHEIISGFLVTMLGVWAAFLLTGLGEQWASDDATRQRLHMVFLESQYNGTCAKEIIDGCNQPGGINIRTDKPNTTAADDVLRDGNIFRVLPHHKISLIRSYINAIATLNEALEVYQTVIELSRYQMTPVEASIKENVKSEAASVLSITIVLQEELATYFNKRTYNHAEMEKIEQRVKYIKEKVLAGEVYLSKERDKSSN